MSKLHGFFLWIGVLSYAFIYCRSWLKHGGIYCSGLITLIIISPIIFWNIENHFVSYKFYVGRVSITWSLVNLPGFIKSLLTVIVLANPVNFFFISRGLAAVSRKILSVYKKETALLLCCSLPLIFFLLFISLFKETLPHWPGPAYTMLLILPALQFSISVQRLTRLMSGLLIVAIGFAAVTATSAVAIINHFPGTLSLKRDWYNLGQGDASLDMYGWKQTGSEFDSLYKADIGFNRMPAGAPIIIVKWFPAAHIDYYIAERTKQQTIGLGQIPALGQYFWLNAGKKILKPGDAVYYIVPSNLFSPGVLDSLAERFESRELALAITHLRGGVICKKTYIFRLKGFR